jgi:hypothetical protein
MTGREVFASFLDLNEQAADAKTGENVTRNVIQIAADPSYLYALCDDGEIFRLVNHVWQPMAPIPQGDPRQAPNPSLSLLSAKRSHII